MLHTSVNRPKTDPLSLSPSPLYFFQTWQLTNFQKSRLHSNVMSFWFFLSIQVTVHTLIHTCTYMILPSKCLWKGGEGIQAALLLRSWTSKQKALLFNGTLPSRFDLCGSSWWAEEASAPGSSFVPFFPQGASRTDFSRIASTQSQRCHPHPVRGRAGLLITLRTANTRNPSPRPTAGTLRGNKKIHWETGSFVRAQGPAAGSKQNTLNTGYTRSSPSFTLLLHHLLPQGLKFLCVSCLCPRSWRIRPALPRSAIPNGIFSQEVSYTTYLPKHFFSSLDNGKWLSSGRVKIILRCFSGIRNAPLQWIFVALIIILCFISLFSMPWRANAFRPLRLQIPSSFFFFFV